MVWCQSSELRNRFHQSLPCNIAQKHHASLEECGVQCLQTVLLGDAAHTMTPALGQGLNSGLEDVTVFAQCLRGLDGNVDAALPAYTKARLPDIKAIMTINEVVASSDVGVKSQVSKSYIQLHLI